MQALFYCLKGGDDTGLGDWLKENILRVDMKGIAKNKDGETIFTCADITDAFAEVYIRELAFWSAVNMVANSVSKCEFKTFRNGKEVKGEDYWRWNYSPNNNQNSSAFIHKWIGQLYRNNEALIIERSGGLLVADSFEKTHNAVREDVFSEIEVEDLSISGSIRAPNVLYYQLNYRDMRILLNGLNFAYAKLIAAAGKSYQWNAGRHGVMNIGTMKAGDPKWVETYNDMLNNFIRPYMESNNGVLPEFSGYTYREEGSASSRSQQTTRDIRALIDDIYELTAKAFAIPAVLLKGQVEGVDAATQEFLTFCIDPLCDNLQEEIVRKQYGYDGFSRGNYLKIDTSTIKHFDLFSNATNVDKLISSGAFSINDIRIAAGETPIDDEWANQHFITKNYMTIQDMIALGGESN